MSYSHPGRNTEEVLKSTKVHPKWILQTFISGGGRGISVFGKTVQIYVVRMIGEPISFRGKCKTRVEISSNFKFNREQ